MSVSVIKKRVLYHVPCIESFKTLSDTRQWCTCVMDKVMQELNEMQEIKANDDITLDIRVKVEHGTN